jgi:hypothetical protein
MTPGWILFADAVAKVAKEHDLDEQEAARRIISGARDGALYTKGHTHQENGLLFPISPAAWDGMDPYPALSMLCTPNANLEVQEPFLDAPMIHKVEIHGGSFDALLAGNVRPPPPIMRPVHARLENKPWVWMDLLQQKSASSQPAPIAAAAGVSKQANTPKPRKRGVPAVKGPTVEAAMRKMDRTELDRMKEVEMEVTFGASRDICRTARNKVLSENVGN